MAKKRRSWEDYQKKKIKRGQSGAPIVILLVLLVIACAGLGVVAWVCLRPVTLPHVQPDQASSTKAPVEYETWKATEAAADGALVQSSDPVVQAANLHHIIFVLHKQLERLNQSIFFFIILRFALVQLFL